MSASIWSYAQRKNRGAISDPMINDCKSFPAVRTVSIRNHKHTNSEILRYDVSWYFSSWAGDDNNRQGRSRKDSTLAPVSEVIRWTLPCFLLMRKWTAKGCSFRPRVHELIFQHGMRYWPNAQWYLPTPPVNSGRTADLPLHKPSPPLWRDDQRDHLDYWLSGRPVSGAP